MPSRYWDFESREVDVPDHVINTVRAQIVPLIPPNFCSDSDFRSDGYLDDLVSCVLDSVGSVGVRYTNVINGLEKYRSYCQANFGFVPTTPKEFLSAFASDISDPDVLASAIWTRHRTATRGGILKVEAMVRWLTILDRYGIQSPQELVAKIDDVKLKQELLKVPGQSRYVSLIYFFMLAGYRDGVKDDRMIQSWFEEECGLRLETPVKAVSFMIIAEELRNQYPCMTAAELDHLVWLVVSNRWSPTTGWHS